MTKDQIREMFRLDRYPLSAKYDPDWVIDNEMGPNVLWVTEAMCQAIELRPGMRVLDLGCGKALSSIFLAKEFGVQVWATDLWISPTENLQRIREAGVEDQVFPIHAEAHSLPFADEFFDAIVSMDAYHFFGTDIHYLETYMLKLLKRGRQIGIVTPASPNQLPVPLPDYLGEWAYFMNSVEWWRHHWDRFPELELELAEELPQGWELWVHWHECVKAANRLKERHLSELRELQADGGRHFGFVRMVGRRREQ
ncbi:MAG: methyltransferase domain-containing protein [SAR202 cluster bacterium]|jgi:SAM-dependent methyltransferase|nr:methyltransferase domain-containing protein [SAR202 cluster bacterium]MDP6714843.1 methyltransferase domain-containing protein [SAR202 cluster bacterium]